LEGLKFGFGRADIKKKLAEGTDGHTTDGFESRRIVGVEDETRNFIGFWGDQRTVQELEERQVGKSGFRSDSFSFGASGDTGELVARFLLVSLGEKLAEVRKVETAAHGTGR